MMGCVPLWARFVVCPMGAGDQLSQSQGRVPIKPAQHQNSSKSGASMSTQLGLRTLFSRFVFPG